MFLEEVIKKIFFTKATVFFSNPSIYLRLHVQDGFKAILLKLILSVSNQLRVRLEVSNEA